MAGWSANPLMAAVGDCTPTRPTWLAQISTAFNERMQALGRADLCAVRKRHRQVALTSQLSSQAGLAVGQRWVSREDGHVYYITSTSPFAATDQGLQGIGSKADIVTITADTGGHQARDLAASAAVFYFMQQQIEGWCGDFLQPNVVIAGDASLDLADFAWSWAELKTAVLGGNGWTRKQYRNCYDGGASVGAKGRYIQTNDGSNMAEDPFVYQWNGSAWVKLGYHGIAAEADMLTSYGRCQQGDIVGPWLYNELQATINELVLTFACVRMTGARNSAGHSIAGTGWERTGYGNTQAAAEAAWAAASYSNTGGCEAYPGESFYDMSVAGAVDIFRRSVEVAVTAPTFRKRQATWYGYATQAGYDALDTSALAGGQWTSLSTGTVTDDATVSARLLNTATLPDVPGGAWVTGMAAAGLYVMDWRVTGGFVYY